MNAFSIWPFDDVSFSNSSKVLLVYGAMMWAALVVTFLYSLSDTRTLRDIGIWIKPMKFMAASALFAWTTVWACHIADSAVSFNSSYPWIAALLIATSLFEVVYITYQAAQGEASHYNNSDIKHAILFAAMGLVAVGLTASQAWLAWEIWKGHDLNAMSVTSIGVVIGLTLTFVLSTASGFLLGGHQPPSGQGLPFLGWHLYKDIRPSHFLGVHAQQLIPLLGLFAERFLGPYATIFLSTSSVIYVGGWAALTWLSLSS